MDAASIQGNPCFHRTQEPARYMKNSVREEMNTADYCDDLAKESYSSAALRKRLLGTVQRGMEHKSTTRRRLVEALEDPPGVADPLQSPGVS
jgi:hypothetical protein